MRIFYSKYFPPKGFAAINIFGIIIGRKDYGRLSRQQINHEQIHTSQIKELLWIFFYLLYFFEWLIRIIQYRNLLKAYYNISFEREAYSNDKYADYLRKRSRYSFVNYYKQRNNGTENQS